MADINNERASREARDTVGAQRPTTGENRVQAAMRQYLGAIAFRSADKGSADKDLGESEKPGGKPRPQH